MGSQSIRLLLAALLSLGCYGLTVFWYKATEIKNENKSNLKPIAFVDSVNDEVKRRPLSKTVWLLLGSGEALYPGEAIRTSTLGEVRIQFADSPRYIDLEPSSMIVISQTNNNEISMDLMDGGLFISQGEDENNLESENTKGNETRRNSKLTLNSSQGKVDLSKATANLSKTQGHEISVQVLKGKAKVEDSKGVVKEIDSGKVGTLSGNSISFNPLSLTIISPITDKPIYVNPDYIEPIKFQWKGFPSDSFVSLVIGKQRKQMKEVTRTSQASLNFLDYKLTEGKYFWKLIAKDRNSKLIGEGPTYRMEIQNQYAPSGVQPEMNSTIISDKGISSVTFQWIKPELAKNVYLEVSKDKDFKQKIVSKNITEGDRFVQVLSMGDYYWRLSALFEGFSASVTSRTYRFSVYEKPKIILAPMVINWDNPIERFPQYYIDKPLLKLAWTSEQKKQANSWRVKIASQESDFADSSSGKVKIIEIPANQMLIQTSMEKAGRYVAFVEAVDEFQQVIGKSGIKFVDITQQPLIAAPRFIPEGNLRSNSSGALNLKWTKVEGAREYKVVLMDANGKEIAVKSFTKTSTVVDYLLPGTYKILIWAIDSRGRESQRDAARNILVPENSGLKAPKLKGVKVK